MNNHIPTWTFRGERQKVAKFYEISTSIRKKFEDILKSKCSNKLVLEYGCGAGSLYKIYFR
ncbi:MAG: hypothetical protein ABIN23_04925 [candidate division WOR-3 bacterium]